MNTMPNERRAEGRKVTFFKAAYIEHDGKLDFVTLRNVSPKGVCFAGHAEVKIGDRITFCFGNEEPREGTVAWTKGIQFGVKVEGDDLGDLMHLEQYQPRAVRLPVQGEARLYVDGSRHECLVRNLSLKGACISTAAQVRPGQLLSLEVGGQSFELATVKWVQNDKAGVLFAAPIPPASFRTLLARAQARPAREQPAEIAA